MNTHTLSLTHKPAVEGGSFDPSWLQLPNDQRLRSGDTRVAALGTPQNTEARCAYENLVRHNPDLDDCISGVFLPKQRNGQGEIDRGRFVQGLTETEFIPGIRVESGASEAQNDLDASSDAALAGLTERLARQAKHDACFARWRASISLGVEVPSRGSIDRNARAFARYVALCRESGVMAVIDPAVSIDGDSTSAWCRTVAHEAMRSVLQALYAHGVVLQGLILKANTYRSAAALSGSESPDELPDAATLDRFLVGSSANPTSALALRDPVGEISGSSRSQTFSTYSLELPWALAVSIGGAVPERASEILRSHPSNVALTPGNFMCLV